MRGTSLKNTIKLRVTIQTISINQREKYRALSKKASWEYFVHKNSYQSRGRFLPIGGINLEAPTLRKIKSLKDEEKIRQSIHLLLYQRSNLKIEITFSQKYITRVLLHEDDPMVIKIKITDWNEKCILIDPRSLVDILYWDAYPNDV